MSNTKIVLNDGLALFDQVVGNATATIDPASIAAAGSVTAAVTVTGAVLGDFVMVASGVSVGGLSFSASVTAADTVTIVLANNTAGAIDLASSVWKVKVLR